MIQESDVDFLQLGGEEDQSFSAGEIEFDEDAGKRWNTDTPINNYDSVQYIYEEHTADLTTPYMNQ